MDSILNTKIGIALQGVNLSNHDTLILNTIKLIKNILSQWVYKKISFYPKFSGHLD